MATTPAIIDPTKAFNLDSVTETPTGSTTPAAVTNTGVAPQTTAATVSQTPTWNNTSDQTVAGQVQGIIAQNSPLLQQAQYQALEGMNARGLTNSTMAQTAGQSAMYSAALPIAQADASQASKVAQTNVQNLNNNAQFNANAQNTAAGQNLQVAGQSYLAAQNQGYNVANMNQQAQIELNKLSEVQKNTVLNMAQQQGYNLQTMSAQQINELAKMATTQGYTQQNMATSQQFNLQTLATQYGFDINKMDKSAALTLQQMSAQQQNDVAKMAVAQGYDMTKLSAQQANTLAQMSAQQANNLQTLATQQGFDLTKMDAQLRNTLSTMSVQAQNDLAKMAKTQGYTLETLGAQQINDMAKLDAQINGQTSIANIEAQYKQLTQASASASAVMTNAQTQIAKIYGDTNIVGDAKVKAIADVQTNVEESMKLIGALAGNIDFSAYGLI